MKKIVIPMLLAISVQGAISAPHNPMEGYQYDDIPGSRLQEIWNDMKIDVKGDHCFRRAEMWTKDIKRNFGYDTRKIFIHYTKKWKENLDYPTKLRFFSRAPKGITKKEKSMAKSNKIWGYHVAPLLQVDGKDVVLDGTLELAYNNGSHYSRSREADAWKLFVRPSTPEEWMEGLTVRGELLWQVRKAQLKEELAKAKKKYKRTDNKKYRNQMNSIRNLMNSLEMDKKEIDITCQRAETMAEIDLNSQDAWCYLSEAPMYYYSEMQLRYLTFGIINGYDYMYPIPDEAQTEQNYQNGKNYIMTEFGEWGAKDSPGEFKSDCKRVDYRSDCRNVKRPVER